MSISRQRGIAAAFILAAAGSSWAADSPNEFLSPEPPDRKAPLAATIRYEARHPDCFSYSIDWGDGGPLESREKPVRFGEGCSNARQSLTFTHAYAAAGTYRIEVRSNNRNLFTPLRLISSFEDIRVTVPDAGKASGTGREENGLRPVPASTGAVVFMSDFGLKDPAVAICKGVMWKIAPDLRIVDLTHDVPPYSIRVAAEFLARTVPFYPAGTVFAVVVDPGVGSARKPVALRTGKGHLLVGPDNGIFAKALEAEGLDQAFEIKDPSYLRDAPAAFTFNGRDIFSPAAAHLASGAPLEKIGPRLESLVPLPARQPRLKGGEIEGEVVNVEDPYGNVVTDIPAALLERAGLRPGDELEIEFAGHHLVRLPFKNTFSDVPVGKNVALLHSTGVFSLSINQGDFAKVYGLKPHAPVLVRRARRR